MFILASTIMRCLRCVIMIAVLASFEPEGNIVADAQGTRMPASPSISAPINDRCINSMELDFSSSINGTNIGSNFDALNVFGCGPHSDANGVWYSVAGDGAPIRAFLCLCPTTAISTSASTNILTVASIAIHTACNTEQSCLTYSNPTAFRCDDEDDDTALELEWNTTQGHQYYIHVRSYSDIDFQLMVQTTRMAVPSDDCRDSIRIQPGERLAGDASNATQDSFQMNQCGGASDQPGIWYSVVGNGNKHSLSMCIAGDNYGYQYDDSNNNDDDVIVSIHDGRCDTDATSCIAYETINARCSQGAVDTVQWMTLPNQTYHLQVRSAVSLPAFKGMIADAEEQTLRTRRDACDAIRDVSPNKAVDGTIDTTTANIFDDSMCGDSVERVGNFYRFFGTGKFVTANLCSVDSGNNRRNSSSNETARLSASIGVSCTMGVCLAHSPRHIASCSESHDNDGGGENGSNVRSGNLVNSHNHTIHRWLALKDRQYYIHISGSDAIDYVLSIEEDVEPLAKNTDVWTFLVISGIAFVGAMMLLRCYMCTMRPQRRRTESRKRRRYKKRRRELNPAAAC